MVTACTCTVFLLLNSSFCLFLSISITSWDVSDKSIHSSIHKNIKLRQDWTGLTCRVQRSEYFPQHFIFTIDPVKCIK